LTYQTQNGIGRRNCPTAVHGGHKSQLNRIFCVGQAPPLSSKNVERNNNKHNIRHNMMYVAAVPVIPKLLKIVKRSKA